MKERFAGDLLFQSVLKSIVYGDGTEVVVRNNRLAVAIKAERRGDALEISIPRVGTMGYTVGERPETIESQFPKLVAGILAGVERRVGADRSIKRVRIAGEAIYNKSLVRLLKDLGFQERWGFGRLLPFLPVARELYLELDIVHPQ